MIGAASMWSFTGPRLTAQRCAAMPHWCRRSHAPGSRSLVRPTSTALPSGQQSDARPRPIRSSGAKGRRDSSCSAVRLADASTATRTACSGTSFGCARAERRRHCELLQLQGGHDDGGAYSPSPYSKRSRAQPSAGRGRYRRMQPARQARPSTASSTWQRPRGRAACHCARRRRRRCARPSFRRKGSRTGSGERPNRPFRKLLDPFERSG